MLFCNINILNFKGPAKIGLFHSGCVYVTAGKAQVYLITLAMAALRLRQILFA